VSAHTFVPWKYSEHGGTFYIWGPGQAMVADGEMEEAYLARIRGVGRKATREEQEANAEFIVRAVNNHDELLAAANALVIPFDGAMWAGPPATLVAALDRLRLAIAKAEAP